MLRADGRPRFRGIGCVRGFDDEDPLDLTLLEGLNDAQREAVLATSGLLAILAGAGTGKTRVISRRAAYAIATGVRDDRGPGADGHVQRQGRRRDGGAAASARPTRRHGADVPRARAEPAALVLAAQHDGAELPRILESKIPIVGRLARSLPGGYRYTPAKDLADEIEWAKSRRVKPSEYAAEVDEILRTPPIPAELFARLYADYERAKERAGQIDFDDMLTLTVELLETDAEALALVQARKRWLSVDEYQDTNPLQERLLELWMGDGRDLCVVGDEDQTIYTFTGATSDFLTGFADRHAGARVIRLTENYRSTPQVLELANRLIASTGRTKALTATRPTGPVPAVRRFPDDGREAAAIVLEARRLIDAGTAATEIAVLVRTNAQLVPLEQAFTRAGLAYQVRGQRFYERRDVREAIRLVREVATRRFAGRPFRGAVLDLWAAELGYRGRGRPIGRGSTRAHSRAGHPARDPRRGHRWGDPAAGSGPSLADWRHATWRNAPGRPAGVNLLTYHRAKGMEWDAVFLPMLEEGSLPIHHAAEDPAALAEERRLLYVGITRARVHLALSWAERRTGATGKEGKRRSSRFLDDLLPPRHATMPLRGRCPAAGRCRAVGHCSTRLRAWRTARARPDGRAGVHRRPRLHAARDRGQSPIHDRRAAPRQGDGAHEARAVRR